MKKKFLTTLGVLVLIIGLTACGGKKDDKNQITLLNGQFSEIDIIMQMAGILIEDETDLKVNYHASMNTVAAATALEKKDVDLYVSYDGTLLSTILGKDPSDVPKGESLFNYAKKLGSKEKGITLLEKFGFENTYAIAIREDFAKKNNITTISDLRKYSDQLVFGAEHEFFDEEGTVRLKPFNKFYDISWKKSSGLDIGLKYAAMDNKTIDATVVYSTDGLNKKSGLRILKDDKKFFPEYYGSFLFRDKLFEEYKDIAPNLKEVLSKLDGKIDNKTMINLNYQVDAEGKKPHDVALQFLKDNKLK